MGYWPFVRTVAAALSLVAIFSSCDPVRTADAEANPKKLVVEPVHDLAVDDGISLVIEVPFEKGKGILDSASTQTLNDFMERSARVGEVKDVKVLSFSDQGFPGESQRDFLKHQKHLADSRSESIKSYLANQYPAIAVQSYNLAANPSALEELVKGSDANVRKTLEDAGLMVGNNQNACVPKIISKSLVVSIMKKNQE